MPVALARMTVVLVGLTTLLPAAAATDLPTLRQNYVDQQYGMFLHFNMGTFTNMEWTNPGDNPNKFNPVALDTDQWAATAKAAGMRYGVLTAKHHDGFALWDTDRSAYDVANPACSWYSDPGSPYYHTDVVQSFADSFRNEGLGVGLYYSIWDRTNGIGETMSAANATAYVKAEITHLLTSYGFIEVLWTDGWGWQKGYSYVNFNEVYNHIKAVSPDTLLMENNHIYGETLQYTDIVGYEQGLPPEDNVLPAETYPTLRADSNWFYKTYEDQEFKAAWKMGAYIREANNRNATCLLNIGPDRNGLIQAGAAQRLLEIKDVWDNVSGLGANIAEGKTATQSSDWPGCTADLAVDGQMFNFSHSYWGDFEPWWMVDLGEMKSIAEVHLINRDGYGGRLRDITIEILAADGTTVLYASDLLNPGNVLGGGIDDYAAGPDPLSLLLSDEGVVGRFIRVSRTPEPGYATDGTGDLFLLTLSEVIVVRTYLPGDADGDGQVDAVDARTLADYWGDGDATWEMGDFDRDGVVGPRDAAILAANWGHGAAQADSVRVPEPATFVLFASVLAAFAGRRRRRGGVVLTVR